LKTVLEPGASASPALVKNSGGRHWLVIGLLFFAVLANYIDRGNLGVAAVPLMRDFGIAPARMGTLLSSFFWTYALLQLPAGYLVDRFGLKWTYAGAFLLWSVASAAIGFANSFAQILLLRLVLGIGEAAVQPASMAFIRGNFSSDQQGLPTAIYLSGIGFGPALGAMLRATLIATIGWRLLFIFTGLCACVWIVPWLLLLPRDATPRAPCGAPANILPWKLLLRQTAPWGITVGAFFYSYFWYYCLTWLPSYLMMARGFSFLRMGTYTAAPLMLMALASMTAARVGDRLIRRFGRPIFIRKLFVVCGFLIGMSILLLISVKTTVAVLATLTLSLTGIGFAAANYWALTQAASPAAMIGRVVGYQNTVANVAGISAPILTGFLVERTRNFDVSIAFAGCSLFIAAGAFIFLVREKDIDALRKELPE
jgi:ACS family D-galactonate transporter-like MFS transporter